MCTRVIDSSSAGSSSAMAASSRSRAACPSTSLVRTAASRWARDCVEASPPKPGAVTAGALEALLPVMRGVGVKNADPANLTKLPWVSAAVWAFYAGAHSRTDVVIRELAGCTYLFLLVLDLLCFAHCD